MIFFVIAISVAGMMIGLMLLIYFSIIRSRVDQHHFNIHQRFEAGEAIVLKSNAHCYGQTTANGVPLRGRGVLFLTKTDVHFEMSIPPLSWRIPLNAISTTTVAGQILTVHYTSKHGHAKTLAWKISHAQRWQETLARSIVQ